MCVRVRVCVCGTQTATPYDVTFSPHVNIHAPPHAGELRVNDEIGCTARGYPAPAIRWVRVRGSGTHRVVVGVTLRISEDMMGDNSWRCRAVNVVGSAERLIHFTVIGRFLILMYYYH